MNCPKCSGAFETVTFDAIDVDRCTKCGGLWFDLMEYRHLGALPGAEIIDIGDAKRGEQNNLKTKIKCPKCPSPMSHLRDVERRDVEYEYCSTCNGAFFDAGEFARYKKDDSFIATLRSLFGK